MQAVQAQGQSQSWPWAQSGTSPWVWLLGPGWEADCLSLGYPGRRLGMRSGFKVRGPGHSVLVLWLKQPEVRVQRWEPKPLSSVVQQRGPEAAEEVQVTESYDGIQWTPGCSVLVLQQWLGSRTFAFLSRDRPVSWGLSGRTTLGSTAVQARNILCCSGG